MRVFGVGCVIFQYADDASISDDFSIDQFKEDVVFAIESIENVSNLEHTDLEENLIGFRSFDTDEEDKLIINPLNFALKFDIFIPKRLQPMYGGPADVETINVEIVHGYDRPVLYCSYEWDAASGLPHPSQTVVVVRKFLEQKISGKLLCTSIACSPLHADFEILSDQPTFMIVDKSAASAGYSRLQVCIPPTDEEMQFVISRLNDTLSTYYYLSTLKSRMISSHRAITTGLYGLMSNQDNGLIKKIKDSFRSSSEIDAIQREVISEKLLRIQFEDYIFEAEQSDNVAANNPIQRFFKEYYQISKRDTWSEFSKVANFFEDRRQRVIANMSVVFAGVFGGIIGAVMGATATYYMSQKVTQAQTADRFKLEPLSKKSVIDKAPNRKITTQPHQSLPAPSTTAPNTSP